MVRTLILSLLFVASLGLDFAGACCSAPPPPPKVALKQADAVFSGTCVEMVIKGHVQVSTFEVHGVWKGDIGAKVVITSHAPEPAMGSFGFQAKRTYLVYCHGKAGDPVASIGSRTQFLERAKADISELGDGQKPRKYEMN